MKPKIRDLSLYVHIPFCRSKCSYCDFLSFGGCGYRVQKQYAAALCKELQAYKAIAGNYQVKTIYIGGGTPSYMDASLIEQIMQTIYTVFSVAAGAEITIEGNPDSLVTDKLNVYRYLGINRLSIGLQSANDEVLKRLGRVHNYDQFVAAICSARQAGFNNVNIDIMSGLPGESRDSYIRTLGKVADLQPEHISAYSLIVEEGTLLSRNRELLKQLPSEEEDRLLYERTKSLLKNSGYERYEISNYAKNGFACRHNMVYWTGGEYLGVGLGASSYLTAFTRNGERRHFRFHGVEKLEEYIGRFSKCEGMWGDDAGVLEFIEDYYPDVQLLERKDEMEEFMFLGLRLHNGISISGFKKRFLVDIESVYDQVIAKYLGNGLLVKEGDRLYLSDAGIDVSNVVMADFML